MTSWQLVRLVAGALILLSLALGIPGSPLFVSKWALADTGDQVVPTMPISTCPGLDAPFKFTYT